MKEEDILLKKLGKENSFKVPDGYFENLTSEVMNKLPEKEKVAFKEEPVSTWTRLKPLLYMAAMFVGAALIIRVASTDHKPAAADDVAVTEVDTEVVVSDEMIDVAVDRAMLDDYSLYVYLSDASVERIQKMRKLIALVVLLCGFMPVLWAADGCDQHLSREEFRAKQKAFIIEQAGLNKEEAAKFFPVYFELQDKKKKLNEESWDLMRKGKDDKTTEAQYAEINEKVANNRIAADQLDKTYLGKFKKILSSKKIFLVQRAEMRFHREMIKGMNRSKDKGDDSKKK